VALDEVAAIRGTSGLAIRDLRWLWLFTSDPPQFTHAKSDCQRFGLKTGLLDLELAYCCLVVPRFRSLYLTSGSRYAPTAYDRSGREIPPGQSGQRIENESHAEELVNMLNSKSLRVTGPLQRLRRAVFLPGKLRRLREFRIIKKSQLFVAKYYLNQYPDIAKCGAHPLWHFVNHGVWEGRNPSPHFDTRYYLDANPDVAASGMNPLVHYARHGRLEGRSPSRDRRMDELQSATTSLSSSHKWSMTRLFRIADELLAKGLKWSAIKRVYEYALIHKSGLFDADYYLTGYKDVAESGMDPLLHFTLHGAYEGRYPGPTFDMQLYCASYPELVASGVNPVIHFLRYCKKQKHPQSPPSDSFTTRSVPPNDKLDSSLFSTLKMYLADRPTPLTTDEAMARVRSINGSWSALRSIRDGSETALDVSIIIPVFNQLPYTLNCIKSILDLPTTNRYEIVVVDDCSNDETRYVLSELKAIRYLRRQVNGGFIQCCNLGASQAQGRYLLFLNNDTVVLPGWLDELVATFFNFEDVGLVGAKLLYPDGTLQEAGCIVWRDGSAWNFGRCDTPLKPEYNYAREVDYCSGACVMIPRELYQELGGFDVTYSPAYYEDTDLALKVRQLGKKVIYQPLSMLIHFEGASCGTDVTAGVKSYQTRNAKKFYERWRGALSSHGEPGCRPEIEKDRGIKRRALFVDRRIPMPDRDSGSITTAQFVRTLQMLGFKVTFIPYDLIHRSSYSHDLQRQGVECIYYPYVRDVKAYLKQCGDLFDLVVVCHHDIATEYLEAIRSYCPKSKVVFHTIDLHYLREEREAAHCGPADAARNAEETKRSEFGAITNSDCTVLVSYEEKQILEREGMAERVVVFPYMYECVGTRVPFDRREGLIFLGSYQHPPNRNAVQWFHSEIFPLVKENIPGLNFYVVGSGLTPEMRRLASDDVILSGYVKDLQPMLDSRRIMVAPLRYGAGIKGKLVIGLSHGLPCVVSPIAAEGMGLTDGVEVLIADTPESFRTAIVRLYNDRELWNRLSTNGMAFVKEHYSIKAGLRYTKEILRMVELSAD
jgi:GT2 family glycosyltransferase/glycosyltransferase involved in cell wall biosynthesis